jgi:kexin
MRFTASWIALLPLISLELAHANASILRPRQYDTREYYALHLSPDAVPHDVAGHLGLEFEGPIGELDDHYLFSGPKGDVDVVSEYRRRRKNKRDAGASDVILFAEKQKVKRLEKRLPPPPRERRNPLAFGRAKHDPELVQRLEGISSQLEIKDPIFHEQWHLFNTVEKGHDVNVTGLWMEGITGHNSTVAMVDDGLDMYSEDLKDNYVGFACSGVGVAFSDRANPCVSLQRVLGILTTRVRNPDLACPTTDTELGVRER